MGGWGPGVGHFSGVSGDRDRLWGIGIDFGVDFRGLVESNPVPELGSWVGIGGPGGVGGSYSFSKVIL